MGSVISASFFPGGIVQLLRLLRPRRLVLIAAVSLVIVAITATAAGAVDPAPPDLPGGAGQVAISLNLLWICIGGALVMFMQAGFALVETGFTRKKNAAHTMGMNVAIFGTRSAPSSLSASP